MPSFRFTYESFCWEQHVKDLHDRNDISFFPQNDAISFKEVKEREEKEDRAHKERVARTADKVVDLDAKIDALTERQSETESKLLEAIRKGQAELLAQVKQELASAGDEERPRSLTSQTDR